MKGPLLPQTGIDPIQDLLLTVRDLTSVLTNIEAKQEEQYKDIMKLREKQEKPNNQLKYGTPKFGNF
jgi:hypothetical protein